MTSTEVIWKKYSSVDLTYGNINYAYVKNTNDGNQIIRNVSCFGNHI